MSRPADAEREGESRPRIDPPADLLAGHPAAAYFWGYVAGAGAAESGRIAVTTGDERAAEVLAAVAGADDVSRGTSTREYAHDTSITRTEAEYTVSVTGDAPFGRSSTLGLPVDGRGGYRFGAFADHRRHLLRGLLESCGTVCFKSSSGTVGISFVHDDRSLLAEIRRLADAAPVEAPTGDLGETSSGDYWFGVDDDAAPALGSWLYEDCEETGLYAQSRRRKLLRSLERAENVDADTDDGV